MKRKVYGAGVSKGVSLLLLLCYESRHSEVENSLWCFFSLGVLGCVFCEIEKSKFNLLEQIFLPLPCASQKCLLQLWPCLYQ